MKASILKNLILITLTVFATATAVAGPGVSSGDEPRADFICRLRDKFVTPRAIFWSTHYADPRTRINMPSGVSNSSFAVSGPCKKIAADELEIQCDLEDAANDFKYSVTLLATGGGEYSTRFTNQLNTEEKPFFIPCEDIR